MFVSPVFFLFSFMLCCFQLQHSLVLNYWPYCFYCIINVRQWASSNIKQWRWSRRYALWTWHTVCYAMECEQLDRPDVFKLVFEYLCTFVVICCIIFPLLWQSKKVYVLSIHCSRCRRFRMSCRQDGQNRLMSRCTYILAHMHADTIIKGHL